MGLISGGVPRVPDLHQQSLRTPAARAAGRPRPQSAAAGPGDDHPSADAVHRLRRVLGAVRVRHRRVARRPRRCALAALDAAVDERRVGFPHLRHRAGQRGGRTTNSAGAAGGSGIRWRTRASCRGWPVRRCCIRRRSPRNAAASAAGPAARHRDVLAVAARHLPGAFGRADQRACVRRRSDARVVHPVVPRPGGRGFVAAVRIARARRTRRRAVHGKFARNAAARQQPAAVRRLRDGAAGHAVSAARRCAGPGQDFRRAALLRTCCSRC
jgi:hypothetical protein